MKIAIAAGHTTSGSGYGAVSGKYKESELTRLVTKELIRLLRNKGHSVTDCTVDSAYTQTAYLQETVKRSNKSGATLFVNIHFNASTSHTANGCEVYTYGGKKHIEAIKVCYELSRLGYKNRGIKTGNHLYVVKNTTAKAILIEVGFLDNPTDQSIYSKYGYRGIAKALSEAIG